MFGCAVLLDQPLATHPTRDQPADLRAAVAAQALKVGQHHPTIAPLELAVSQAAQHRLDPGVAPFVVLGSPELQRLRSIRTWRTCSSVQTWASFMSITIRLMIDSPRQRAAVQPPNPSLKPAPGSFLVGITRLTPGSYLVGQDLGWTNSRPDCIINRQNVAARHAENRSHAAPDNRHRSGATPWEKSPGRNRSKSCI